MTPKKYALSMEDILPLVPGRGACMASDRITVDRMPVGTGYRQEPDRPADSGWRFLAGDESDEYLDDPDHFAVFDLNTIANYDPDIIPFLGARVGAAFERSGPEGTFVRVEGPPPEEAPRLVRLTSRWGIALEPSFQRRTEDGNLVFSSAGRTIWLAAWGDDEGRSTAEVLAMLEQEASRDFIERYEPEDPVCKRFAYLMKEASQWALYAFTIAPGEYLQIAFTFDDREDLEWARRTWDSVVYYAS